MTGGTKDQNDRQGDLHPKSQDVASPPLEQPAGRWLDLFTGEPALVGGPYHPNPTPPSSDEPLRQPGGRFIESATEVLQPEPMADRTVLLPLDQVGSKSGATLDLSSIETPLRWLSGNAVAPQEESGSTTTPTLDLTLSEPSSSRKQTLKLRRSGPGELPQEASTESQPAWSDPHEAAEKYPVFEEDSVEDTELWTPVPLGAPRLKADDVPDDERFPTLMYTKRPPEIEQAIAALKAGATPDRRSPVQQAEALKPSPPEEASPEGNDIDTVDQEFGSDLPDFDDHDDAPTLIHEGGRPLSPLASQEHDVDEDASEPDDRPTMPGRAPASSDEDDQGPSVALHVAVALMIAMLLILFLMLVWTVTR